MTMRLNLEGRSALVCASSAGIGKGIAENLVDCGCNVIICGRDEQKLNMTYSELSESKVAKVLAIRCDLDDSKDIQEMYKKASSNFGSIDILVHNQGGPPPGELKDISIEDLDNAYSNLLKSVFLLNKLCIPDMINNSWGRIINVLSVSVKQPLPNMLLSNMFRPALQGMAKSLANELGIYGITVNSLLPANVLSSRTNSLIAAQVEKSGLPFEEIMLEISNGVPMKKMIKPNEFGALVAFLSSDKASFITGTTIPIDGGMVRSLT